MTIGCFLAIGLLLIGEAPTREVPPPVTRSLEERVRDLETINQQVLEQNRVLLEQAKAREKEIELRYQRLERKYEELRVERTRPAEAKPASSPPTSPPSRAASPNNASRPTEEQGRMTTSPPSRVASPNNTPDSLSSNTEPRGRRVQNGLPLNATLGEGFQFETIDEEYQLRLHILDQTDFKVFVPGNQDPARSGLYIPRVRMYFEGQLTRMFDYEVSIQRSIEGVWDLLDGNLTVHPSEAFQLKFGRMLVPYSYDWYDHLEQYFLTAERSLFPLNFGLSRSAGILAQGRAAEGVVQYAVGGFDGHLVGLADDNTTRDAVGYLNFRPFLNSEFSLLRNLNLGGSGFLGEQVSPVHPLPLRTSIQSSDNAEAAQRASSVFLVFDEKTYALGGRSGGALHLAWYGKGFSLESELQTGRNQYARAGEPGRASVPVSGFNVGLGYFLTGEEVSGRGPFEPLHPFDISRGKWGPGAFELFGRFSSLTLGPSVFSAGLADRADWTRQADLTDLGLNWYLTKQIKTVFEWQHIAYANSVLINPGQNLRALSNDLFWFRMQLYY